MGGPPPGEVHKPSEVPLTGQEESYLRPTNITSWAESGTMSLMGANRGSHSKAISEPQEEPGVGLPRHFSSAIVSDFDTWPQSSREQEAVEEDPGWRGAFEPSVLIKS